jgi:bacteriocin biosynthesis cyclodehydratase domain-containing protein
MCRSVYGFDPGRLRLAEVACGSPLVIHRVDLQAAGMNIHPGARLRYCPDAPITWRKPGVVGFGDDPQVIVHDVTARDLLWLTGLTGMRTGSDLMEQATSAIQRRLLDAAICTGSVEDLAETRDSWRMLPAEQRARLSGDLAAYRHTYRSSSKALDAMDARLQLRVNIHGHGQLHDAFVHVLHGSDVTITNRNPDVIILTSLRHPDALATDVMYDHTINRTPHIPVQVFGNRGVIGPLVIPEQTACTTCWHLRQRDCDPGWTLRAAQFAGFSPAIWPMDQFLVHAVVAHTVLMLHAWRANLDAPHLWANHIRTLWLPDGSIDIDRIVRHPECGCARSPLSGRSEEA